MKKYWQVLQSTLWEIGTYRFNFAMWRLRIVLQFLTTYFLWLAITPAQGQLFGYSQQLILTYVLGTALVGTMVFSTRTHEIGANIDSGDLSLFLLRPLNYFKYWFARDLGDKLVNIAFVIGELLILYVILHPPVFLQMHGIVLFATFVAICIAVVLNFYFGSLLGLIAFWSPEVWAPRFLYFILVPFLSGAIVPLDIFPQTLQQFLQLLPFSYLIYFPVKLYLGSLTFDQIIHGMTIGGLWIVLLHCATQVIWLKGLKSYSAQGR